MKNSLLLALSLMTGPLIPAMAQTAQSPLDLPVTSIVQPVPMGEITNLPTLGGTAIDVISFTRLSQSLELAYPNNYNIDGCIERELHDGQFLAGGCKDGLYALRRRTDGNFVKAAHLGLALMANAQHGNPSLQVKGGLNLGTFGQIMAKAVSVVAPKFADVGSTLPPWTQKIGDVIEFDFAGGPRLWHDKSVNGNWAYGFMATLNVPIEICFDWISGGL